MGFMPNNHLCICWLGKTFEIPILFSAIRRSLLSLLIWWVRTEPIFIAKTNRTKINFLFCRARQKNVRVEIWTKSIIKCDLNNWIVRKKTIKLSWCFEKQICLKHSSGKFAFFRRKKGKKKIFSLIKILSNQQFFKIAESKGFQLNYVRNLSSSVTAFQVALFWC